MSITLPNVRKLFIPDSDFMIFDADLAGADAQVVAWEAGDEELKEAFRKGLKVHLMNAKLLFPDKCKGMSDDAIKATVNPGGIYYSVKRGVHGTNYGANAKTLAQILGWTVAETETFQRRWFGAHPGIKRWQERTEMDLRTRRKVTNAFGYSRTYFDRIDALLPQALAWIPQSTVALVTFRGAQALRREFPVTGPRAQTNIRTLVQVHDSLVFQIRKNFVQLLLPRVQNNLIVPVPYPDPLTIQWGLAGSVKSWGDAEEMKWPDKLAA